MKRFVMMWLGIVFCVLCSAGVARCQQDKPLTVPPKTEIKLDHPVDSGPAQLVFEKMKNAQLSFQVLQDQYAKQQADLQSQFAGYQAQLTAWTNEAKKANGLGDDVEYDPAQDKWFRTSKDTPAPAKSGPAKDVPPAKK